MLISLASATVEANVVGIIDESTEVVRSVVRIVEESNKRHGV
jgi:hypothetical protein